MSDEALKLSDIELVLDNIEQVKRELKRLKAINAEKQALINCFKHLIGQYDALNKIKGVNYVY